MSWTFDTTHFTFDSTSHTMDGFHSDTGTDTGKGKGSYLWAREEHRRIFLRREDEIVMRAIMAFLRRQ